MEKFSRKFRKIVDVSLLFSEHIFSKEKDIFDKFSVNNFFSFSKCNFSPDNSWLWVVDDLCFPCEHPSSSYPSSHFFLLLHFFNTFHTFVLYFFSFSLFLLMFNFIFLLRKIDYFSANFSIFDEYLTRFFKDNRFPQEWYAGVGIF